MKVYKIKFDYRYALADIVESLNGADSLDLSADTPEMLHSFRYDWLTDESDAIPDLAIIMSELLCVSESVSKSFAGIVPEVELVPIMIGEKNYYCVSNVTLYDNCVNIKKSKITRFSDGNIMEITSLVLLPKQYPTLFRVPEVPSVYFCTEMFKKYIEENDLTGLSFEECQIKSNSWF